jgi:hypothetical protein
MTYHIVAPIPHCLFEIVCATICLAKTLEPLDTKELSLFLFSDTTHSTAQRRGHGKVRFQIAL